jgi:Holliday junction resolvase RusA-like endonuclease
MSGFTEKDLRDKGYEWNGKEWIKRGVIKLSNGRKLDGIEIKKPDAQESITFISHPENSIKVEMKPMSVNGAWQGRRFKTPKYLAYEKAVLGMLPKYNLPEPPYRLELTLGVSSKLSDIDNPVKLILDILQKAYSFNDKLIFELLVKKQMTEKRKEFFKFSITHIDV